MGLKEEEDPDPAEDDDFEVDLAAVDDVSFASRFVAAGFEALESESIPLVTPLSLHN